MELEGKFKNHHQQHIFDELENFHQDHICIFEDTCLWDKLKHLEIEDVKKPRNRERIGAFMSTGLEQVGWKARLSNEQNLDYRVI